MKWVLIFFLIVPVIVYCLFGPYKAFDVLSFTKDLSGVSDVVPDFYDDVMRIWETDFVQGDTGTILDGFLNTEFAEVIFGGVKKALATVGAYAGYRQWIRDATEMFKPWNYFKDISNEVYQWEVAA